MEDLFKKFINAGVGFVSLTNDRVQSTINKLVEESKLSEQEGAKIMDDLKKNTDVKRKELEKQFQGLTSRLMKTVGVAPNAEMEELKRTVKGSSKTGAATSATSGKASAAKSATGSAKPAAKPAAAKSSATPGRTAKAAESKTEKANKTAAKKAISPNDNTSTSGSPLS